MTFLFERYVRPRIPRIRHRFHHHMMEEWYYHIDQAARASHVLRFIESYCEDNDDVYRTFTVERLARAVSDTRYSLDFNNRTIEEAGFLDAFEGHYRDILAHLEPSHLPDAEKEILKDMGSLNPEVELRALVFEARALCSRIERSMREVDVRQQLQHAQDRLKTAEQEFEEKKKESKEGRRPAETQKKSRRWFKGLGQIAQGSAFSIANVALAVGALKFPVSPETQTWGAVASVSTGVCTVLSGIGDLRNE
ncbi:MAG: hypothetical protein DMG72_13790 [Acidobacteria bacterium]|nr:MAG: hypothetical protein DMG72_13790 [Acidobacteriota bacterium]